MKVSRVIGYLGEGIVNLVIYRVLFGVDVLDRDLAFFPEWHDPITVESAAGIHTNSKGREMSIFTPSCTKEIAQRHLYGRSGFIIPIHTQDGKAPGAGRSEPDMLNSTGARYLRQCVSFAGFNNGKGAHFPSLPQFACSV